MGSRRDIQDGVSAASLMDGPDGQDGERASSKNGICVIDLNATTTKLNLTSVLIIN